MGYTTADAETASSLVANSSSKSGFAFTAAQRRLLLAAKAAWQEDERHLDNLAELSRTDAGLARLRPLWENVRTAHDANALTSAVAALIPRVRAIVGNSALNQGRITPDFGTALQALVFGDAALPARLTDFLSHSGVGPRLAGDLLYAAQPDRFPRLSPFLSTLLKLAPEQETQARRAQQALYLLADGEVNRSVLSLLGRYAVYEEARRVTGVATFAELDAIIRHAPDMLGKRNKKAIATVASPAAVQEAATVYATEVLPPDVPDAHVVEEATEADLLRLIEAHASAKGFTFAPLVVANYYIALKAKPFVILTGLSGTGKTRLTRLVADAITGNNPGQYLLLPVRPDWTDGTPLLGYQNLLTGKYVGTSLTNLLSIAAQPENRQRAFFVCLDEMNLARVEHYFADALSAMETEDGHIPLQDGRFVTLGPNVHLTGSVNQDEATFPFSRKVLDRANTIEFGDVRFSDDGAFGNARQSLPDIAPLERQRLFQESAVRTRNDAEMRLKQFDSGLVARITDTLSELNERLSPRGLHFGYRVRDEVLRYVAASFTRDGHGLLTADAQTNSQIALDLQILQKVLPRVAGTDDTLSRLLRDLAAWSEERGFPRSAAKLDKMRARASEEGLVTFYDL